MQVLIIFSNPKWKIINLAIENQAFNLNNVQRRGRNSNIPKTKRKNIITNI